MDVTPYSSITPMELGSRLAAIREAAAVKQAELARRITWSPAMLSRVESGERALAPDELSTILTAIGTPAADKLLHDLERTWTVLPRPQLDHPDTDLLWEAELVAQDLEKLRAEPDVRLAFERRLSEFIGELRQTAALLLKREHLIAFVGSIGIGKSTAICRMTKLEVSDAKGGLPIPVLEAGAGGITICEVHLRTGPAYGVIIEPRSDNEIRADVTDFAEHILRKTSAHTEDSEDGDTDVQGISKEIERAIRNMARLSVRRVRGADGKVTRSDEAQELARQHGDVRELAVAILARMELHSRDRRDIWYDTSSGKEPLVWLKDTFEKINNGRHPEFSLPRRLEVVVPTRLLEVEDLSVRIVDTKGIDRTAARADLEHHLDDPHTLTVLCSGFNNAPAAEARLLLERAREVDVRSLESRTLLLVLPRPNEALAVKDESGTPVETAEEGYELKGEQILLSVEPLHLTDYAVGFFNAHQDDPLRLRSLLADRLAVVRHSFRTRLEDITKNAKALVANHEKEETRAVVRQASDMFAAWIGGHRSPKALTAHVQESLLGQMAATHVGAIRASINREGEWPNFSYSHHLAHGARRVAVLSCGDAVHGFAELCGTMLANPHLAEASDLIAQANRVLQDSYEELLRKVQLMGQTIFHGALRGDSDFWSRCQSEWGRGPGYRTRVTEHNVEWFNGKARQELEATLYSLIDKEWRAALERVSALLMTED